MSIVKGKQLGNAELTGSLYGSASYALKAEFALNAAAPSYITLESVKASISDTGANDGTIFTITSGSGNQNLLTLSNSGNLKVPQLEVSGSTNDLLLVNNVSNQTIFRVRQERVFSSTLAVGDLTVGQVVIGGGNSSLSTIAINGTGSIVATTGATNVVMTGSFSGSLTGNATTASHAVNSLITASVSSNTITFTKGDGSTFPITVNTGSGASGGSTFPFTGSAIISGSLIVTGSLNVSAGITGSLFGSASYSTQALSSSYSNTSTSASYAITASYVLNAVSASFSTLAQTSNTASYVVTAQTASFVRTAQTASYVQNAVSSSFATSASYALSASLAQTASYAYQAAIQYVTNSLQSLTGIEVADFDSNTAVTFVNGVLKFIFGTPTAPSAPTATFNSTFVTNRFNKVTDNYDITGSWTVGGYTLISASLWENNVKLTGTTSGTSLLYNTTTTGSRTYVLQVTASSPLDGSINSQSTTLTGTLSKTNPGSPTITPTATVQLGSTSNQIEQGATGSISFTSGSGTANSWIHNYTLSSVATPIFVTGSATGSTSISATATSYYSSSGVLGADNSPALTTTTTNSFTYTKIRSVRAGVSSQTSFTADQLENLALWDITLGGSVGTIAKGTTDPLNYQISLTTSGQYFYFVVDSSYTLNGILNVNNSNSNDLAVYTANTVGNYKVYRSNNISSATILYKLTR